MLLIHCTRQRQTKPAILKMLLGQFMLLPFALLAQEQYIISGTLKAAKPGDIAYLLYRNEGGRQTDSVVLKDGQFQFSGTIVEPSTATIAVGNSLTNAYRSGSKSFYLEPGTITITSPDSILHAVVKGGKINEDYNALEAALSVLQPKQEELRKYYTEASEEERQSAAFREKYEEKSDAISEERKTIQRAFLQEHPNSFVSLDLVNSIAGYAPEAEEVEKLYNGLSDEIKQSPAGQRYADIIQKIKATAIGQPAPEFTQNDTLGNPVSLSDFRGKYVLIDFWASWCGPCRRENPNVVSAYHQFKDKNFTVLGVSLDQPGKKDAWLKAIHDDKLEWTQVSDLKFWDNEVAKLYYIRAIPQNLLIDPTGKIIAKNLRGEGLIEKLSEYITPNASASASNNAPQNE